MRQALTQCPSRDELRRRDSRSYGAQPRAECIPDALGIRCGKVLHQTMRDEASLDKHAICAQFSRNGLAVFPRLAMPILRTGVALERRPFLHSEVVRECTNRVHGLLEAVF